MKNIIRSFLWPSILGVFFCSSSNLLCMTISKMILSNRPQRKSRQVQRLKVLTHTFAKPEQLGDEVDFLADEEALDQSKYVDEWLNAKVLSSVIQGAWEEEKDVRDTSSQDKSLPLFIPLLAQEYEEEYASDSDSEGLLTERLSRVTTEILEKEETLLLPSPRRKISKSTVESEELPKRLVLSPQRLEGRRCGQELSAVPVKTVPVNTINTFLQKKLYCEHCRPLCSFASSQAQRDKDSHSESSLRHCVVLEPTSPGENFASSSSLLPKGQENKSVLASACSLVRTLEKDLCKGGETL